MMLKQIADQAGCRNDTGEDAGKQDDEEGPINVLPDARNPLLPKGLPALPVKGYQGNDESLINTGDKRNGSPETPGTMSAAPWQSL